MSEIRTPRAPSRRKSRPRRARSRRPSIRCRGVEAPAAGNSGRRCLAHGARQSPARRSRRASHFRRRPGRLREDDAARAVGCPGRETICLDHARSARQRPDRAAAAPRRCDRRAGAHRWPGAQRARRLEAVLLEHRRAARSRPRSLPRRSACSSSKTLTCSASRTRSRSCRCSPSTSPRARQSSSRAGSSARSPHGCGCAAACWSSGRPISRSRAGRQSCSCARRARSSPARPARICSTGPRAGRGPSSSRRSRRGGRPTRGRRPTSSRSRLRATIGS